MKGRSNHKLSIRRVLPLLLVVTFIMSLFYLPTVSAAAIGEGVNIALDALATAGYVNGGTSAANMNNGAKATGAGSSWNCWGTTGLTANTTYIWTDSVVISSIKVMWWYDGVVGSSAGVQPPKSCTAQYFDEDSSTWKNFTNMTDDDGAPTTSVGVKTNGGAYNANTSPYNGVAFDPVSTRMVRLTITTQKTSASATAPGVGISEWEVYSSDGESIAFRGVNLLDRDYTTKDIVLPATSTSGYSVTWQSLTPNIVTDSGKITRTNERQNAILRATATKDGVTYTRDYKFTILAIGEAQYNLKINEDNLGIEISPTLHGIFFEDINHSLDGGLNAQLIDNGSFQQYKWPDTYPASSNNPRKNGPTNGNYSQNPASIYSWRAVQKGTGAAGTALIVDTKPLNANNQYSVEINITDAGTGTTHGYGIGANGYSVANYYDNPTPTIAVNAGWKYDVSMYLQGLGFSGNVTIFLENVSGELNSNIITVKGSELTNSWKQFAGELTAIKDENNRLVVMGDAIGKFYLKFVQLTPSKDHLWRDGAAGGLRADMAEALAELQPKFMRFPGGCASEGCTELRQYFWKQTVGPREERKGIPNYWGYWSSNELGFYEYFCLAEELGAEPLPVINNGVTCQFQSSSSQPVFVYPITPESNLEKYKAIYVQDALDLIEFCNGDITTEWGAKRAEYGHPEPFNLKYVAIGNENGGSSSLNKPFWDRFDIIYKAVKEKYPDIEVITNSDYLASGSAFNRNYNIIDSTYPATIVDEHYYMADSWFLSNSHRYDPGAVRASGTYDRNKPTRVFVGEYAGNSSTNSQMSAVAEAAFTTGLERNSDMVKMACYAPTFSQNSNGARNNWPNNMIWFDNTGIWRTPNYYFHKMFAANIGDRIVEYSDIKLLDGTTYRAGETSNEGIYKVVSKDTKSGDIYIKLVNAEADSKNLNIELNGTNPYMATMEYIAAAATARNQPTSTQAITNRVHNENIQPVTDSLGEISKNMFVTLKPYSVNVIKLTPGSKADGNFTVYINNNRKTLIMNNTVTSNITIKNNTSESAPALCIMALYDANNVLVDVKTEQIVVPANADNGFGLDLKLPSDVKGHTLKVYCWEGTKYKPLCDYKIIN